MPRVRAQLDMCLINRPTHPPTPQGRFAKEMHTTTQATVPACTPSSSISGVCTAFVTCVALQRYCTGSGTPSSQVPVGPRKEFGSSNTADMASARPHPRPEYATAYTAVPLARRAAISAAPVCCAAVADGCISADDGSCGGACLSR